MRSISLVPAGLLAALLSISISPASAVPLCGLKPPRAVAAANGTSSNSNSNPSDGGNVLASAWYPGWLGDQFPPSSVSWSKYNVMTFAFAVTTPDTSVLSLDSISQKVLPQFVTTAKQNGVTALISIGGWTGSQYFSTAVSSDANRAAFVKAVTGLVTKYNLDGVDFDWEYPNHQGVGCNVISPNDSPNFLTFLQLLRKDPVGAKMVISGAVGLTPFAGTDGTPMADVSEFGKVFDHIAIMAYDIWGSWSTTGVGPNAPLNDSCATTKAGSAVSAVNAWAAAKFPVDKLALGVAAYGHSFHVSKSDAVDSTGALAAYPPFDASKQPHGDKNDGEAGVDQCGAPVPVGGIFNFWGLIDGGFLTSNGTAASGMDYRFDSCSQTPYVYNPTSEVMVSYDDAASFAAKGEFINDMGLKGFAMWHVAGDSNDILMNAIHDAMGIEEVCA